MFVFILNYNRMLYELCKAGNETLKQEYKKSTVGLTVL